MSRSFGLVLALLLVIGTIGAISWPLILSATGGKAAGDSTDAEQVALGATVYRENCAECHGANLEGQPNWQQRLPDGTMPAPPHDETGHTWHHPDQQLFDYTKLGGAAVVPPPFQSAMPAFGEALSDDDIWAVLAFIKSRWPERQREIQAQRSAQ
jgi:mono/diheme cytochrome c family protein